MRPGIACVRCSIWLLLLRCMAAAGALGVAAAACCCRRRSSGSAAPEQDASKARESRLRKAGLQGRARMASELRDMDNDIAALSKALAVSALYRAGACSAPAVGLPAMRWGCNGMDARCS